MIGINAKTVDTTRDVTRRMRAASFRNIGHALAQIRKTAMGSIKSSPKGAHSPPGQPPETRKGRRRLPRSILYDVERTMFGGFIGGVVGPTFSRVGTAGAAHEFGGPYKGQQYPARPFMGPSLMQEAPRIPWYWQYSLR